MKNRVEIPAEKLRLNVIPEKLLLVSGAYNSILVVCDRFSKMLYFIAMTEKIIAERLARLFRNNV